METKVSEQDGLADMKCFIEEFLNSGHGSPKVREYISSAAKDESLLLIYLKGRKYKAKHAWETLKRQAEIRFDEYPEVFPEEMPDILYKFERRGVFGLMKTRDKLGRRIGCFNGGEWDPNEVTLEEICAIGTHTLDTLLLDKDVINNGLIIVQNCEGMGMKHARQYSLHNMLLFINVYLAYPINIKGMYFANVPFYLKYIYKIIRPFLTKKLKKRVIVTGTEEGFQTIHEILSADLLPKFLGGDMENTAAFDMECFHQNKKC